MISENKNPKLTSDELKSFNVVSFERNRASLLVMLSKKNEENKVVLLMTRHAFSFPGNNELTRIISQLSEKHQKLTSGEKRSN